MNDVNLKDLRAQSIHDEETKQRRKVSYRSVWLNALLDGV
jgi:hypothetical protein